MSQADYSTTDRPISSKMSEYIRNYIKTQSNANPNDLTNPTNHQNNNEDFRFEYLENVSEKGEIIKKKRGRPRKTDQKPAAKEGKAKRGRKRKQPQQSAQGDNNKLELLGSRAIIAKRQNTPDNERDQKTVSIQKKRKRRPSSKQPNITEIQISQDELEEGPMEEPRKRGRPPKSKSIEGSPKAPSKHLMKKWKGSGAPLAQMRLISRIRDKLSTRKDGAETNSVETHEKESSVQSQRKSDSDPYFQILQIKKRSKDIHYLVQIGERIRWATKEDLIDDYAIELVKFYEERLLVQSMKEGRSVLVQGSESRNLYMKYE